MLVCAGTAGITIDARPKAKGTWSVKVQQHCNSSLAFLYYSVSQTQTLWSSIWQRYTARMTQYRIADGTTLFQGHKCIDCCETWRALARATFSQCMTYAGRWVSNRPNSHTLVHTDKRRTNSWPLQICNFKETMTSKLSSVFHKNLSSSLMSSMSSRGDKCEVSWSWRKFKITWLD